MSDTAPDPRATPPVFDVDALLKPIPGDSPTGEDPRADTSPTSPYYQVKDARNAARAAERAAAAGGAEGAAEADWQPILRLAPKFLTDKAKDLEIVAWYVEALVRRHGMPGLRDGFRLARGLVETFWDGLHPMPDSEGVSTRVAPFTGLNGAEADGTLIVPIRTVAVTAGESEGPFSAWQHGQAVDLERVTDEAEKAKRETAGAVSMKRFLIAVKETNRDWFLTLRADLAAAKDEYEKLCAAFDGKCGGDAPPASNIRATLEAFGETFLFVTRDLGLDVGAEAAAESGGATAAAGGGGQPGAKSGAVNTREDAFRMLEKVAEFFRSTEPHSPLSYTLSQAVRWGRMPLPELLKELIPDESARESLFKLTGIPKPPAQE